MNEEGERAAGRGAFADVGGADAGAGAAVAFVLNDADGEVDFAGVEGLARRDGIKARGEAREKLEELLRVIEFGGAVLKEVDKLAAPEIRFEFFLVAGLDERGEVGVAGVFGPAFESGTGELADHEPGSEGLAEGEGLAVEVDNGLAGEAEALEDEVDSVTGVDGEDAGGIAREVLDAGAGEVKLDVAGFFFGAGAGEETVFEDGGGVGIVARPGGDCRFQCRRALRPHCLSAP